jgi:hypothetical protein
VSVRRKQLVGAAIALALAAGGAVFVFIATTGIPSGPATLSGGLWTAEVTGEPRLYFVVAQELRSLAGARLPRMLEDREHRLVARALTDGADRAAITIGRNKQPRILGIAAGLLWLRHDDGAGVEGRDLDSLEVRVPAEAIAVANAVPVGISARLDRLIIRAGDGALSMFGPDQVLEPLTTETIGRMPPRRMHALNARPDPVAPLLEAAGAGLPGTTAADFLLNGVLAEDAWYVLLAATDLERVGGEVTRPARPRGDGPYGLYRFAVTVVRAPDLEPARALYDGVLQIDRGALDAIEADRAQLGRYRIDQASKAIVTGERYKNAGLVLRRDAVRHETGVLQLADPASVVVMSRAAVEDTWQLTRLALDGTVIWQRDTGLADLRHMLTGNRALVLGGHAGGERASLAMPFDIVHIAVGNGQLFRRGLTGN